MAKAQITTTNGTKIVLEGTPDEVAAVLNQIEGSSDRKHAHAGQSDRPANSWGSKPTPVNLISSLIDGGFFKKPKDLGAVKVALEEMGHHYPVTTLSPVLLRLIRKRHLRRMREQKRWVYTGAN
jgi:hypothetical protein